MIKLKLNKFNRKKWRLLVHIAKKFKGETIFQNTRMQSQLVFIFFFLFIFFFFSSYIPFFPLDSAFLLGFILSLNNI